MLVEIVMFDSYATARVTDFFEFSLQDIWVFSSLCWCEYSAMFINLCRLLYKGAFTFYGLAASKIK